MKAGLSPSVAIRIHDWHEARAISGFMEANDFEFISLNTPSVRYFADLLSIGDGLICMIAQGRGLWMPFTHTNYESASQGDENKITLSELLDKQELYLLSLT